jgi:hypothetical protein
MFGVWRSMFDVALQTPFVPLFLRCSAADLSKMNTRLVDASERSESSVLMLMTSADTGFVRLLMRPFSFFLTVSLLLLLSFAFIKRKRSHLQFSVLVPNRPLQLAGRQKFALAGNLPKLEMKQLSKNK